MRMFSIKPIISNKFRMENPKSFVNAELDDIPEEIAV